VWKLAERGRAVRWHELSCVSFAERYRVELQYIPPCGCRAGRYTPIIKRTSNCTTSPETITFVVLDVFRGRLVIWQYHTEISGEISSLLLIYQFRRRTRLTSAWRLHKRNIVMPIYIPLTWSSCCSRVNAVFTRMLKKLTGNTKNGQILNVVNKYSLFDSW